MRFRLWAIICLLALAAAVPLSAQTIQGCVDTNKGTLRIVKAGEPCDSKEYALSWKAGGSCEPPAQIGTVNFAGLSGGPFAIYQLSGGAKNPFDITSGGTSSGKVEFSAIVIVRKVDAASPRLMKWVASGTHIPNVKIDLSPTRSVKLSDALLTAYAFTQLACSEEQFETISVVFGKIEFGIDGVTGCWDIKQNKGC